MSKKTVSIGGQNFEPVQNVETDAICSCCKFLHYCTKHNPADGLKEALTGIDEELKQLKAELEAINIEL